MRLQFLGKAGSDKNNCPTLYASDQGSFIVQGWETDEAGTVEIPHVLLGFARWNTFLDSPLTDTGRGTFTVSGRPVTDGEALSQMTLDRNETAIEVPKAERTFYGGNLAQ
ncbi:hypothetical protein [Nocardia sp. NPDC056000]|uniref:hypothetical protein n=1 Tax=Nocardia sp. NPDC056000 TaxID=3345674 RepID=UPI0035E11580